MLFGRVVLEKAASHNHTVLNSHVLNRHTHIHWVHPSRYPLFKTVTSWLSACDHILQTEAMKNEAGLHSPTMASAPVHYMQGAQWMLCGKGKERRNRFVFLLICLNINFMTIIILRCCWIFAETPSAPWSLPPDMPHSFARLLLFSFKTRLFTIYRLTSGMKCTKAGYFLGGIKSFVERTG